MKTWRVTWEIDIDADTPREAAEIARRYQLDPNTMAVVFDVTEHEFGLLEPCNSETKTVDLADLGRD